MKQVLYAKIIFFMFLVLSFSSSSARLLPQDQDDKEVKTNNSTLHEASFMKLQEDDNIFQLMGLEECNEKDEECESRRMVAEAHLDYIYTQHHKPKALP